MTKKNIQKCLESLLGGHTPNQHTAHKTKHVATRCRAYFRAVSEQNPNIWWRKKLRSQRWLCDSWHHPHVMSHRPHTSCPSMFGPRGAPKISMLCVLDTKMLHALKEHQEQNQCGWIKKKEEKTDLGNWRLFVIKLGMIVSLSLSLLSREAICLRYRISRQKKSCPDTS